MGRNAFALRICHADEGFHVGGESLRVSVYQQSGGPGIRLGCAPGEGGGDQRSLDGQALARIENVIHSSPFMLHRAGARGGHGQAVIAQEYSRGIGVRAQGYGPALASSGLADGGDRARPTVQ